MNIKIFTVFTLTFFALQAVDGQNWLMYAKEIQETSYLLGSSFTAPFSHSAVNFIPDKDSNRKGECLIILDPQQEVKDAAHMSIAGRYYVRDAKHIDISKVVMNGQMVDNLSIVINRQDRRHATLTTHVTDGSDDGKLVLYIKRNADLSNNKAVFTKEISNSSYRVGRTFTQLWRNPAGMNMLTFKNTPGSSDRGRVEFNFLNQVYSGTFKVRNGSIIDVKIDTFMDGDLEGSMTIVRTSDKYLQAKMEVEIFDEKKFFHWCFVKQ